MGEIISREAASAAGLKRFFTGEPCKNGHLSVRATKSGDCVECNREKSRRHSGAHKEWYEANREQALDNMRRRYQERPEEYKEKARAWEAANPEKMREAKNGYRRSEKGLQQARDYYAENKEKHAALTKAWKVENPAAVRAYCRGRQASKIRATPGWADMEAIKAIYAQAVAEEKADGIPRHVDHVIPLQGENVCGLHVEKNLKVVYASENCAKGNRFDGA